MAGKHRPIEPPLYIICVLLSVASNTPHTSLFEHVPSPTVAPTGATPKGEPHFCQCDTGLTGTPRINCTAGADVTHRTQRVRGSWWLY